MKIFHAQPFDTQYQISDDREFKTVMGKVFFNNNVSKNTVDGIRRSQKKAFAMGQSPSSLKLRRAKVEPGGIEPPSGEGNKSYALHA